MSRKSAIQYVWVNFPHENSKCALQRGKRKMLAKGRATIARKNAFLDLGSAMERLRKYQKSVGLAKAMGWFTNMKPVDVQPFIDRHAEAVLLQRQAFAK